jgi:hypothetical protein
MVMTSLLAKAMAFCMISPARGGCAGEAPATTIVAKPRAEESRECGNARVKIHAGTTAGSEAIS